MRLTWAGVSPDHTAPAAFEHDPALTEHGGAGADQNTTHPGIHGGLAHHDNQRHPDHIHRSHAAVFRDRFWWSLALSIPVIVFSHMFADLLGYQLPAGAGWVSPVLGTAVYAYGGQPFLTGAVAEIRSRRPGMMLLVGLAITVAFAASLATSLDVGDVDLDFWWELALLVDIMLLGHWLEMRALGRASNALDALAALLPDQAERLDADGTPHLVSLADLAAGDLVLVRPGGRVPADGLVTGGRAAFDESMITGESLPVERGRDERVAAGSVATDSAVRIRVDAVGEQTALAGIRRLTLNPAPRPRRAPAPAPAPASRSPPPASSWPPMTPAPSSRSSRCRAPATAR